MACLPIHPRKLAKNWAKVSFSPNLNLLRCSDTQMPAQHCWHSFNKILAGKSSGSIFHPIEDMFLFVISRSLCPPTLGRNATLLGGEGFAISTGVYMAEEILRRFERQGGW